MDMSRPRFQLEPGVSHEGGVLTPRAVTAGQCETALHLLLDDMYGDIHSTQDISTHINALDHGRYELAFSGSLWRDYQRTALGTISRVVHDEACIGDTVAHHLYDSMPDQTGIQVINNGLTGFTLAQLAHAIERIALDRAAAAIEDAEDPQQLRQSTSLLPKLEKVFQSDIQLTR